ncbi:metal ABC transporter substrate-binding protein [Halovenus salina]|uniref:Metal ABC transporter substrate-binding protein n=1 Tax=Halovenus salina TaxID=1510225 RepID=A0ABD5W043_9EURY|nr:metal ABC transporter substrate-binding protein [Halovenus salina]
MNLTRRRLLSGVAGAGTTAALAGCIGGDSDDSTGSSGTTAEASFFVFGDIMSRVAGETADGSLLVPVGQHGHGWEPGASIRQDIREADLFVHGMPDFQPWADDIRTDLEADNADVTSLEISRDIGLLEAGGGGHDHAEEGESHNEEDNHDDHNEEDSHDHDEDEHHDDHNEEDSHDHDEDEHHDDHDEDDNHDGHDHGSGMDPHFWMDPLRVKTAVDNASQGLAEVDPENEEVYAENAEELKSDLDDLHEQIEAMVADASTNVILVAGHNSFQYFSARYGIEVAALTNVSPDDRPTLEDRQQAQEVIDRHDLQYICADPLESQQAATQLVGDTDAQEVLSLTAMPGLTDDWESEGWGYIEVMENVNLPTLERVLDA